MECRYVFLESKYSLDNISKLIVNNTSIDELWDHIQPQSIDYGLLEKSDNILVVTSTFKWNDIGSWDALCDVLDGPENIDSAGDVPSPALVSAIRVFRKDHIKKLASEIGYSYKTDEDFKHKVDTSQISSKNVFTI